MLCKTMLPFVVEAMSDLPSKRGLGDSCRGPAKPTDDEVKAAQERRAKASLARERLLAFRARCGKG